METQGTPGTALSKKLLLYFLIHQKKGRVTFVGHSWNSQGTFFPGTLFRNCPRNFIANFFQIYREYLKEMFHKYSTNIHLPGG